VAWDTGLTGIPRAIAEYPGSPLRLMAGPGTGKTFALMRRIGRHLETGTPPSNILAVTFTRTAAQDLLSQLKSLGSPGADQVTATTLHSLSFSLLREQGVFRANNRMARPLLDFEADGLVSDLAKVFGGRAATSDMLKAFAADWATLQHHQPGWPSNPAQQHFHRELTSWLLYHQAMLIEELVTLALDYLRANPASPHAPQYAHVLADEYQDLNRADQELIDALARNGTLTVAGDQDQSIYTTLRHAQPEGIVTFGQTHPNTHDESLNECRRCPHSVVSMANALILHNHPSQPSTIQPMPGNSSGSVFLVQHDSIQDEVNTTSAFIHSYLANHTEAKPSDVLILSTRRAIGNAVRDELGRLGRPAQSFFSEQCLDKVAPREGMCLLTLLARPTDRVGLRAWLGLDASDGRAAGYERIRNAADAAGLAPRQLLDVIVAGQSQPPPWTHAIVARYQTLNTRLGALAGATGTALVDLLWPPHEDNEEIRGMALAIASGTPSPEALLEELVKAIIQPELPSGQSDIIRIMSLQKSKGLTARCVLVLGCVAGALPMIKAGLSPTQTIRSIEEQRRLFYVAITRTSETLAVSSAATSGIGEAKQMGLTITQTRGPRAILQASQFLSEFGGSAPGAVSGRRWRAQLGF